ncbi:MAG: TetR family transcriptional regulator C-terminal domain-containing protein [Alphaproteobacteria bacterium]
MPWTPTTMNTMRDRILRATQRLLGESGLAGAALNHLIAASGAPRGSLYHYFPGGKAQWVGEALVAYGDYFAARAGSFLQRPGTAAENIEALFADFAARMAKADYKAGCPVGAVILDLTSEADSLRPICQSILEAWQAQLVARLDVIPEPRRAPLARFVLTSFEGASMMARVERNNAPFLEAGALIRRLIEAEMKSPPANT